MRGSVCPVVRDSPGQTPCVPLIRQEGFVSLTGGVDVLDETVAHLNRLLKHSLTSSSWRASSHLLLFHLFVACCTSNGIFFLIPCQVKETCSNGGCNYSYNLILEFNNMSQKRFDLKQVCLFFKPGCHPGIYLQAPSQGIKMFVNIL